MNSPVSQFRTCYIGMQNCETDGSLGLDALAMLVNKLYNLDVSVFSNCLKDFLSLLLIKGSMVQKEAFRRLDAETAVLSFLVGTQGNHI